MAHILIADDHTLVRKAVRDVLSAGGHETTEVENGRQAVAAIAVRRPDLVLLDILMPEQDGIETILVLRQQDPGLRILAISAGGGFGRADFLATAKKLGADAVLQKPFDGPQLLAAIDELLASRP